MVLKNLKITIRSAFLEDVVSKIKFKYVAQVISLGFIFTILSGNLFTMFAGAYGQPTYRTITMSNATPSATGVNYYVSFIPATGPTIGSIDIDFCANDPIIGDSCTTTGDPSLSGASVSTPTGFSTSTGSWGALYNSGHTSLFESNATAQTPSSLGVTAITFTISNVTNPSTTGGFYARIYTFDTQSHGNSSNYLSGGNPGTGILDAGGDALSTVAQITITAKVQETISFCVYTGIYDGAGGACSGPTGYSVTLGNSYGVLSSSSSYTDISTKYDIQTNALHGATIVFTGTPPTSSSNVIQYGATDAMGTTAGTSYVSVIGANSPYKSQFGLCTWSAFGATSNITPVSPYGNSNCSSVTTGANAAGSAQFGFDTANAANTSTDPYGSEIATATPGNVAAGEIAFLANISATQIAGIYSTTLNFIATGSY
jgi:hypothetical protein